MLPTANANARSNKKSKSAKPPTPPTLSHLTRCEETMTSYIAHYITHNRPSRPITHLIICAGHPSAKILVTICNAARFASPSGKLLVKSCDPVTGEPDPRAKDVEEDWDDGEIRFNGVGYRIVVKEGPVEEERWMDEEGFYEEEEERVRVQREEEEERKVQEELERVRREKAAKNKAKRDRQKERKRAAKVGDEVTASEHGGETEVPEDQTGDSGEAKPSEKEMTWAEKAAAYQKQKS
ncbi:hypothetical protein Slin15195_G000870 [Septoria linicola]|uniref:Uncharacterized protein n=1 Tax=Septoria linicola TaxID=215465 RepID=A0A9Q9AIF1_9PEZI|nr:hypothetical protein Slin15195_G000870 [Septoria linicola]